MFRKSAEMNPNSARLSGITSAGGLFDLDFGGDDEEALLFDLDDESWGETVCRFGLFDEDLMVITTLVGSVTMGIGEEVGDDPHFGAEYSI